MIRSSWPRMALTTTVLGLAFSSTCVCAQEPVRWEHLSSQAGDLAAPSVGKQAAALLFDVDRDGTKDLVIAGWSTPSMVWFRRTGDNWRRYLVDDRGSHIEAGGDYFDIDGDGDLDVLHGGNWKTNEVWWWENPYPEYQPDVAWPRHTIKDQGAKQHHDQVFGDFDADGDIELVFWNQQGRQLVIGDIPSEPKDKGSWHFSQVWTWPAAFKYEGLVKVDIDGDGKGGFVTQILSTGIGTHEGKLGDLDGDGDVDILQKGFQHQQRIDIWLNQ